jgi:hypothetical protein
MFSLTVYPSLFLNGGLVTKNQRRKHALKSAREVQEIHVFATGNPIVCDSCISCSAGKVGRHRGCFIDESGGSIPPKGYCAAFEVDPERDPRSNGKVLLQIMKQQGG